MLQVGACWWLGYAAGQSDGGQGRVGPTTGVIVAHRAKLAHWPRPIVCAAKFTELQEGPMAANCKLGVCSGPYGSLGTDHGNGQEWVFGRKQRADDGQVVSTRASDT